MVIIIGSRHAGRLLLEEQLNLPNKEAVFITGDDTQQTLGLDPATTKAYRVFGASNEACVALEKRGFTVEYRNI